MSLMNILLSILGFLTLVGLTYLGGYLRGYEISTRKHLKSQKPENMIGRVPPKFVMHGGEIKHTDGNWHPIGPARLAELYGIKKGNWVPYNPRINEDDPLYYGNNCIHLTPLYEGNYKHHLAMRLHAYHTNTKESDLLNDQFYQQCKYSPNYHEYTPVNKH